MSAELNIPDAALATGWHEFRYPRPAADEPTEAFRRGLAAAAPLIVAAELKRMAEALPMPNHWDAAYQAGRYDAHQALVNRARELRGEQS